MKTGVIVYVAGKVPDHWDEDPAPVLAESESTTDACEFVTSGSGGYDIHYAWWRLLTRGMRRIVCRTATFDRTDKLVFTGREMRLCG